MNKQLHLNVNYKGPFVTDFKREDVVLLELYNGYLLPNLYGVAYKITQSKIRRQSVYTILRKATILVYPRDVTVPGDSYETISQPSFASRESSLDLH